jgi:hypothetical protein
VLPRQEVAELFHALAAVMSEEGLPWYLFGAQAAMIWGSPRFSLDADITVAIERSRVESFVGVMKLHGFDLRFSDSEFVERSRVFPFVHRSTGIQLDVVLAGPGFEEDFLRRAISVDVMGTKIPVISPEDLIITKVLAGRPKDEEDIRNVIAFRKASLDAERIRSVLHLLEQALGQSDLLPLFEREWQKS